MSKYILIAWLAFCLGSLVSVIGQLPTSCDPFTAWDAIKAGVILLASCVIGFFAGRENGAGRP